MKNLNLSLALMLTAAMMSACSAKKHVESAITSVPQGPNGPADAGDGSDKAAISTPEDVKGHWVSACFTDAATGEQRQIELTIKDDGFEHKDTRFTDLGCTQVESDPAPVVEEGKYKFLQKFDDGSYDLELDSKIGENGNGVSIDEVRLQLQDGQLYMSEGEYVTRQKVSEQTVLLINAPMTKAQ
jgi:hypothetical protein